MPVTVTKPDGSYRCEHPKPGSTPPPSAQSLAGLTVTAENRCSKYDRSDYSYPQSVRWQIVASMDGRIYAPYEYRTFASIEQTQISRIVAPSEAHDSGLCRKSGSVKQRFARDLDNLTLASPKENRSKSRRDAAEWRPRHNACWFADRVVAVKAKYGLTVDRAEFNTLSSILKGCDSVDMVFPGDGISWHKILRYVLPLGALLLLLVVCCYFIRRKTVTVEKGEILRFSPSWIAKIFGAEEVVISSVEDSVGVRESPPVFGNASAFRLCVDSSNRGKVEVDVQYSDLDDSFTEGLLFFRLKLKSSKDSISIKCLPRKSAQTAHQWLKKCSYRARAIALEEYLYRAKALVKRLYRTIADDVSRSATEVRGILNLGYLRDSRLDQIRDIAKKQQGVFGKPPSADYVDQRTLEDFKLLYEAANWTKKEIKELRSSYVAKKMSEFSELLRLLLKAIPLTPSQRRACVVDQDNNLVLAGAGTGKTSTMIGRAGFLVKSGQARPSQILLLAFAQKSCF